MAHPNQPWPWSPTTHPWRLVYESLQKGYWRPSAVVYTFETEAEMRAFPAANPGRHPSTVTEFWVADIPAGGTWNKQGKWKRLPANRSAS